MKCNPDINRIECWLCQHNPFVQRVPVIYAGGNLSPGGKTIPVVQVSENNPAFMDITADMSPEEIMDALKDVFPAAGEEKKNLLKNDPDFNNKDGNGDFVKEVYVYVFC